MRFLAAILSVFVLAGIPVLVQVPSTLARQSRESGLYQEGLVFTPKTASALTLVSALATVTAGATFTDWPKDFSLRFFIPPDQHTAFVRLRQFSSQSGYYVLDDVASRVRWKPGALNEFSWPADVMAGVYTYQASREPDRVGTKAKWLGEIGMIVRLDGDGPIISGGSAIVAPAVLYGTLPAAVTGYRFGFTTNATTTVQASVTAEAGGPPLMKWSPNAAGGGLSTIIWPATGQKDGWYRLLLTADFPGQPQMVVRFYHRRTLSP